MTAMRGRAITLAFAFLSVGPNALAATWHVDAGAGSAGDGSTWTQPLRDVSAALARARPGDEVWLKAGVHRIAEPLQIPPGVAQVVGRDVDAGGAVRRQLHE